MSQPGTRNSRDDGEFQSGFLIFSRFRATRTAIFPERLLESYSYSSLAYLKRFPIDYLKIDQSFVRGVPGDLDDSNIVRAIIALGRSLDIKLIAEGVETEAQRAFLHAHDCHEMQGYLFCRPKPAHELTDAFLR